MSQAIEDVLAERQRQKEVEGWTERHDDKHRIGVLGVAGASYVFSALAQMPGGVGVVPDGEAGTPASIEDIKADPPPSWPWDPCWWKPSGIRRDLVKAAALIIAEIERLDRNPI